MFIMSFKKKSIVLFLMFSILFASFFSCKTKKAPLNLVISRTVVIQVCDKFQMSYDGLNCVVHFTDGSSSQYRTATDGKITVKLPSMQINIEKVVYDFTGYVQRGGTLLAKEDYKMAKKITSNKLSNTVVVEDTFSSKAKNLFVLIRI